MSRRANGQFAQGTSGNPGRQFQKGQSGNPGGRPKMPEELKAAMQGLADDAVRVLREAMQSSDERVRVLAAGHVLDRGYGKPAQSLSARFENADMSEAHLAALQELARKETAPLVRSAIGNDAEDLMNPVGTAD